MAGNNLLQILRGSNPTSYDILNPGQLFYNKNKGYLHIGYKNGGNSTQDAGSVIKVRELIGYPGDASTIGTNKQHEYHLRYTGTAFELKSSGTTPIRLINDSSIYNTFYDAESKTSIDLIKLNLKSKGSSWIGTLNNPITTGFFESVHSDSIISTYCVTENLIPRPGTYNSSIGTDSERFIHLFAGNGDITFLKTYSIKPSMSSDERSFLNISTDIVESEWLNPGYSTSHVYKTKAYIELLNGLDLIEGWEGDGRNNEAQLTLGVTAKDVNDNPTLLYDSKICLKNSGVMLDAMHPDFIGIGLYTRDYIRLEGSQIQFTGSISLENSSIDIGSIYNRYPVRNAYINHIYSLFDANNTDFDRPDDIVNCYLLCKSNLSSDINYGEAKAFSPLKFKIQNFSNTKILYVEKDAVDSVVVGESTNPLNLIYTRRLNTEEIYADIINNTEITNSNITNSIIYSNTERIVLDDNTSNYRYFKFSVPQGRSSYPCFFHFYTLGNPQEEISLINWCTAFFPGLNTLIRYDSSTKFIKGCILGASERTFTADGTTVSTNTVGHYEAYAIPEDNVEFPSYYDVYIKAYWIYEDHLCDYLSCDNIRIIGTISEYAYNNNKPA